MPSHPAVDTTRPHAPIVHRSTDSSVPHRERPQRRRKFGRERRQVALLLLAPSLVHLVWWIGLPVVATFALAFTDYDILAGTVTFNGLDNFQEIFSDPTWNASIWHTVVFTFFTVPVAMVIAVVLALLLNVKMRGRPGIALRSSCRMSPRPWRSPWCGCGCSNPGSVS